MKYAQIGAIKVSLEALKDKELPIAYELARNLLICDKFLEEAQGLVQVLHTGFADRDSEGVLVKYIEEGKEAHKISDPIKLMQFQKELLKLENEEHEIKFIKIKRAALENTMLTASVLVPLIDTIIED